VGYGEGYVGYSNKNAVTSSLLPYEENSDVNGYNVAFYGGLALSQNDFFETFYTGMLTGGGAGQYDGYYSTSPSGSSGLTLIGQAYLPNPGLAVEDYSGEQSVFNAAENCPYVAPKEYFGTNGSGTPTFMNLDNGSWTSWTSSIPTGDSGGVAPYPASFIQRYTSLSYSGN
jgi:hypothetical protein